MRLLGIDFGTKNIGVAISDDNMKIASPWLTITYPKNNYLYVINHLRKQLVDYQIAKIVLGYPINLNGTISKTAEMVLKFKKLLEDNLKIEVVLYDERFSTQNTTEMLKEFAELKNSQIKKIKDKLSAQYILQQYIDLKLINRVMDLQTLKTICIENHIPIIRDKTLDLINHIIDDNGFTSILEVGTAYGYSAFAFSLNPHIKNITTIEKKTDNYSLACEYLKDIKKIHIVNLDVIFFKTNEKFDLIFIDGAKSHQEIMFEHCQKFLNNNGIIVVDNIFLKKFNNRKELTRNQKRLLSKVKEFETWLVSRQGWNVKIIKIDDGVAICKKK